MIQVHVWVWHDLFLMIFYSVCFRHKQKLWEEEQEDKNCCSKFLLYDKLIFEDMDFYLIDVKNLNRIRDTAKKTLVRWPVLIDERLNSE